MAYLVPPVTNNSNEERHVYWRAEDNLPHHILGKVFWISSDNHLYPGYYLHKNEEDTSPVEFIDNVWYDLTFRPYNSSFWIDLEHNVIKRHKEGTCFWYITDLQHPDYISPVLSPTSGSLKLSLPRERTISIDTAISPLRFTVLDKNSDSDSDIHVSQVSTANIPVTEEDVLAAQLEHRLDLLDRESKNPAELNQPHYQNLVALAV